MHSLDLYNIEGHNLYNDNPPALDNLYVHRGVFKYHHGAPSGYWTLQPLGLDYKEILVAGHYSNSYALPLGIVPELIDRYGRRVVGEFEPIDALSKTAPYNHNISVKYKEIIENNNSNINPKDVVELKLYMYPLFVVNGFNGKTYSHADPLELVGNASALEVITYKVNQ